jgi:hypothetical protein
LSNLCRVLTKAPATAAAPPSVQLPPPAHASTP